MMFNIDFNVDINIPLMVYLLSVFSVILGGICRGYYEHWKENIFQYKMAEPVHIITEYRDFERLACESRIDRYYLDFDNKIEYNDMLERAKDDIKYRFAGALEPFLNTEIIERDYETGDTIIRSEILVSKGLNRR